MKQIIKLEGIVLKVTDYKEEAVLATILTKNGLNNYIIKGVKKMTSGTRLLASPLTKLEFNATHQEGLNTLTEGIILDNYLQIKQNYNKITYTFPIIEKILTFAHQVTNNQTFYQFVNNILNMLKDDIDEFSILTIFEVKLTYLIGISPELKTCIKCGTTTKTGAFSIYHGGIICNKCNTFMPYDLNNDETESLKLLYLIKLDKVNNEFIEIVKKDIKNINIVIDKHYEKHLDFKSKSKQVIKEMESR